MNNKLIKKITIMIIIVLSMIFIGTNSKAALECKPGGSVYDNVKVNDSYLLCYDMRNGDSTLGNNALDPHLTTNLDWGAAAYLGLSAYGDVRSANGTSVTINGKKYNSTTNNITGIMNMGKNLTQTASLYEKYSSSDNVERQSLITNKDTKYVELLSSESSQNSDGMAFGETKKWFDSKAVFPAGSTPVGVRSGILGYDSGSYSAANGSGKRLRLWGCYFQTGGLELEEMSWGS